MRPPAGTGGLIPVTCHQPRRQLDAIDSRSRPPDPRSSAPRAGRCSTRGLRRTAKTRAMLDDIVRMAVMGEHPWMIDARRRRNELREFGSTLSTNRQLKRCGFVIRIGRVGSATEIMSRETKCRLKWLCPVCGYIASRRESAKLARRLRGWTAQGGAVAFLTLTQSHCWEDDLSVLWSRLDHGWAALTRGSGWDADKATHGLQAYVRITEVVHHPSTGWQVHFHVCLLLDENLDQAGIESFKSSLTARFKRGLERREGSATGVGQDLTVMRPLSHEELAAYCFKGTRERFEVTGSRSPIAILSDLNRTGEGGELWDEWTAAVSNARRVQVVSSRRIDQLCGVT